MENDVLFLLIALCATIYARYRLDRPLVAKPPVHRPATIPELAWLAGGQLRVMDTFWTALHQSTFLTVDDEKHVLIRPGNDTDASNAQFNTAKRALMSKSRWKHSEVRVRWLLDGLPGVERSLEEAGWIHEVKRFRGRMIWQGLIFLIFLACVFLPAVSPLTWSAGVVSAIVVAGIMLIPLRNQRTTEAGNKVLEDARKAHAHQILAPTDEKAIAMAVALSGPIALAGTPWVEHASPSLRQDESAAGGCGTHVGVSGWGDADGGGGGCGGGCGGD